MFESLHSWCGRRRCLGLVGSVGFGMADRRRWVREALIVGLGVLVVAVSAFLPSFEGWLMRGVALVAVAAGVGVSRWLERKVAAEAVVTIPPPVARAGLPAPPRLVAGREPRRFVDELT